MNANVSSARILKKGQITNLSTGFKLPVGTKPTDVVKPFSIIIIPISSIDNDGVISSPSSAGLLVSCKLFYDSGFSNYPVYFNQETVAYIVELDIDSIDLNTYMVFWGSGYNVVEFED